MAGQRWPVVSTDETSAGTSESCQTVDATSTQIDECRLLLSPTITRDGATVAGSSQLPVRRHFSPEIYLLTKNSEIILKYAESTRKLLFLHDRILYVESRNAQHVLPKSQYRRNAILVRSNGEKERGRLKIEFPYIGY